jgi:hypothetical protein
VLERIPKKRHLAKAALAQFHAAQAQGKRLKEVLQSLEKYPSNASLMFEAGEIFMKEDNDTMALLFLVRSIGTNPMNRRAHELLIDYYDKHNLKEKADLQRLQLQRLFH